jgi:S-adenosylmethionine hydrolase
MIAFLTDWGHDSYYVGVAKAVIREINRDVEILDICHNIKPFSVRHAAYVIERVIKDLPADTVFLAVVDPGVGTSRKPVAMVLKTECAWLDLTTVSSRWLPRVSAFTK